MQNLDTTPRSPAYLPSIGIIIAIAIVIAGTIATISIGNNVDRRLRSDLLIRAQNAALLLSSEEIVKLHADDRDLANPAYLDLKEKMTKLIAVNPDARFFYLMGYDDPNLFFYVDSEDTLSGDYSPPGQKYVDATATEVTNFIAGTDYVEGPYTDSWGRWISASAHIKDASGNVVAKLGIDVDAKRLQKELLFVRGTILSITILLALLFGLFALYAKRSFRMIDVLSGANATLTTTKSRLEATNKMAHLGTFRWTPKSGFVSFDEGMYALTHQNVDKKLAYDSFRRMLAPKDEHVFDMALEKAKEGVENFSLDYTIYYPEGGSVALHSECTIEHARDGSVATISGTAQAR